jgi:hypothetical protein
VVGGLGGGVEAHPEQRPDRAHLPFLIDGLHPLAEEAVEEAAVRQLPLQLEMSVGNSLRSHEKHLQLMFHFPIISCTESH